MTDSATYFAWYYVISMVIMALFIRFYYRKKRMRNLEEIIKQRKEQSDQEAD